jgi:hypothetical protein
MDRPNRPNRARLRWFSIPIVFTCGALLLAWCTPLYALVVEDATVKVSGSYLVVDVSIDSLFSDEVAERLRKGMPATLVITVDLWRDRSKWFDHMVATRTATYRMRYDIWSDRYEIQRDEGDVRIISNLDSLSLYLERPQRIAVTDGMSLNPEHKYYAALSAYLRPLTLEDIEDVEKYLGRSTRGGPSLGSVVRLPDALMGFLFAVSGFEDEVATHRTGVFRVPESVRWRGRPPAP